MAAFPPRLSVARHLSAKGKEKIAKEIVQHRQNGWTWDAICHAYGISEVTARKYKALNMSVQEQKLRRALSGRPSLLKTEEELEVLRLARLRRAAHLVVDNKWTRDAFSIASHGRVLNSSDASISRFWKRRGWPTHRIQARTPGELRDTLQQEAADFQRTVLSYVEAHEISAADIWIADETGMWNGSVALRSRIDPDTMDNGGLRQGDNTRDTAMVALSGAGAIDSWFLEHQKQVTRKIAGQTVVVQKQVAGMGTDEMKKWAPGFIDRVHERGSDKAVLILDRLGSHRNKQIHAMLEAGGVKPFLLPPQASKLISPLDNTFFASFKARMRQQDTSTTAAKKQAFQEVIDGYTPEEVKAYFEHCHWNLDPA